MKAWDVILYGECIDTVWFDEDMDEWDILHSLIEHDGYHPTISVCEVK